MEIPEVQRFFTDSTRFRKSRDVTVARVMKRDIVAFSDHGQEFRISKKNPVSIHSENSEMVKRARMRHDLEKRQRLVGKTIDRLPKIRMDEEFLDFVEKWAEKNNLLVKE